MSIGQMERIQEIIKRLYRPINQLYIQIVTNI